MRNHTGPHAAMLAVMALGGATACGADGGVVLVSDAERTQTRHAAVDDEGNVVLPNWATDDEQALEAATPPPEELRGRLPPASGLKLPAELAPTRAVVMTWAGYTTMLKAIAGAVA